MHWGHGLKFKLYPTCFSSTVPHLIGCHSVKDKWVDNTFIFRIYDQRHYSRLLNRGTTITVNYSTYYQVYHVIFGLSCLAIPEKNNVYTSQKISGIKMVFWVAFYVYLAAFLNTSSFFNGHLDLLRKPLRRECASFRLSVSEDINRKPDEEKAFCLCYYGRFFHFSLKAVPCFIIKNSFRTQCTNFLLFLKFTSLVEWNEINFCA